MGSVLSSFSSSSSPPPPLPLPPSPPPEIKYDVFLSFRGDDTRDNFTSHLHTALRDKGIDTFIDYKLRSGDEISPALLQAIEESQIAIIIFSEHYASSRWCLEELVKILECKKNHGQIVIPVFYEIDPSNVRKQTGTFEVAFASHQRRFEENLDKVQKWRCALEDAANLSGFDSRVVKPESVLVEKIVGDVLERLNNMPSSDDNEKLVGVESRITEIILALGIGDQTIKHVCRLGIWGIGGIGKTTLARAVYNKIFYQFEGHHFVDSVREALEKEYLPYMQQKLYSAILKDENACTYPFTKKRLSHKKLLIVFDDVSNFEQVKSLIDLDCVGSGSRVIVISRDQQVLKNSGVDYTFKVEDLCFSDALKLFCQHAFKQNRPKVDYKELSKCVVERVGGVPLALKVLGSFLLGKEKDVWKSSMKKLEKSLDMDIHKVLKISYDGLDCDQQKVFLDIACFYKGWYDDEVIAILNASGFCTANDISALIDKSLIFKSNHDQLMIHDLLQAMGEEIVKQESFDDPGKRSRLWDHEEIYDILTNATGTEKVEGIYLNMSESRDIYLHPCALAKMTKMRYLGFSSYCDSKNKVHVLPGLQYVSTKLRYLHWYGCPLKSLESNFYLKKLVILSISHSEVEELWRGVQQFDDLKSIELRKCNNLTSIPNCSGCKSLKKLYLVGCSKLKRLSEIPSSLEHLRLNGCESLIELPSSFKHLNKLRDLDVGGCKSLTSIPDLRGCESLEDLCLEDCLKLKMLPELPNSIQYLSLINSLIEELPDSLCCLTSLNHLEISYCERLKVLPKLPWANISAANCTSLEELSCPSFCNDFFAQNSDVDSGIGVDLDSCYKLDRNSLDNFLKDILQNLEGLAASAKTSYHHQVCGQVQPCISVCYPKSEIPGWFRYQKDGSFIDLSLPKDLFNYNFLCFAVCVVVEFQDHQSGYNFYVNYECKKKSEKGDHKLVGKLSFWVPKPQSQNGRSNHVIFGVDFYVFPKPCDNEFTFQFYSEPHLRTNIEKCGVHLVFGKHHEISDESEDIDEPNLEESDQENEPHPKRLKHF